MKLGLVRREANLVHPYGFARSSLGSLLITAMLAGCGSQPPLSTSLVVPTTDRTPSAGTYKVVVNFTGTNGSYPDAGFRIINNTLYDTKYSGSTIGLGVVFAILPSGAQTIVYSSKGSPK